MRRTKKTLNGERLYAWQVKLLERIERQGVPELVAAVHDGRLPLHLADEVVSYPRDEQRRIGAGTSSSACCQMLSEVCAARRQVVEERNHRKRQTIMELELLKMCKGNRAMQIAVMHIIAGLRMGKMVKELRGRFVTYDLSGIDVDDYINPAAYTYEPSMPTEREWLKSSGGHLIPLR